MKPGAGLKEGEKVPGKTTGTLMSIAGLWKKKAVDEEAGTSSGRGESEWESLYEISQTDMRGYRCRSERKQQSESDSLSNRAAHCCDNRIFVTLLDYSLSFITFVSTLLRHPCFSRYPLPGYEIPSYLIYSGFIIQPICSCNISFYCELRSAPSKTRLAEPPAPGLPCYSRATGVHREERRT